MSERARPPRARAPSFIYDDGPQQQPMQAQYGHIGNMDDASPPGSSSGGHSGEALQRGYSGGRSKQLPPAPHSPQGRSTAHAHSHSLGGNGPYDDPQAYAGAKGTASPRSSYSDDAHTPQQQLHLRHVAGAKETRVEGMHPGYAGSIQGVQGAVSGGYAGGQHQHQGGPSYAASDRDSFFAPPAMPWMRGASYAGSHNGHDRSNPGSRPESPSFFGGSSQMRTSSASPMPFYPSTTSLAHPSGYASTYLGVPQPPRPKRTFQSNLLTGPVEKPWLGKRDRWVTVAWWTTVLLWFSGVAGAAVICFFAYRDIPKLGRTCRVFTEDFNNLDAWTREVGVGGYGTGGFEWTTTSDANAFIKGGMLHIAPTLTRETGGLSQDQILDGTDLTIEGCTKDTDSSDYFIDKPLGSAAGLRRRSEVEGGPSLVRRAFDAVAGNPWKAIREGLLSTELPVRSNARFAAPQGDLDSFGHAAAPLAQRQDDEETDDEPSRPIPTDGAGGNGVSGGAVGGAANGQHDRCRVQSSRSVKAAVNPVQSARLTTKSTQGGSMAYGRVEIRAKMPTGDWLFPQIMLLPTDYTAYGRWPLSGEIDMVMARGNDANYDRGGRDFITSGLQWGPGVGFNAFDKTRGWWQQRRTNFNQAFHTFTLEWSPDFLWVFVDRRVQRVINLNFKKDSFFERGRFPDTFKNGTDEQPLRDPWAASGQNSAPFDREFHLVLTVGAGGTNGWFPDLAGDKPWFDRSNAAMWDFANATDTWAKTWPAKPEDRAMVVDYVHMEKRC